jgi:ribosomal protein S12 methylthiotransferase accessory factor YcaO
MKVYTGPGRLGVYAPLQGLPIVVGVDGPQVCWGKGSTATARLESCIGELLERRIRRQISPDLVSSAREIGARAVDPRSLGIDICADRILSGTTAYDDDLRTGWVAVQAARKEKRFIHWPSPGLPAFYALNSNGAAVHTNAAAAERTAILELLERDAYLRWWYQFESAVPLHPHTELWKVIRQWLAGIHWGMRAYTVAAYIDVPVVLCVATRHNGDKVPDAVAIGTACTITEPSNCAICQAAGSAALEIVQFVESALLSQRSSAFSFGPYERYFTPDGVADVHRRLPDDTAYDHACDASTTARYLLALQEFHERCWFVRRRTTSTSQCWFFRQAFHPDVLPFPLPGVGRRLDHPALRQAADGAQIDLTSLPLAPHPLG